MFHYGEAPVQNTMKLKEAVGSNKINGVKSHIYNHVSSISDSTQDNKFFPKAATSNSSEAFRSINLVC